MADLDDTYRRETIRARFEYRGLPPRDKWDAFTGLEREVAETLVKELGEKAFTGTVISNQLAMDAAFGGLLVGMNDAFPKGELTPDKVDEVTQSVRRSMAGFSQRAENILITGASDGRKAALRAHQEALEATATRAGVTVSDDAIVGLVDKIKGRAQTRRTVEMSTARLMRRSTVQATEVTTSWIRGRQGTPGREAARQIMKTMGEHPRIDRALKDMGPRGRAVRRAIERAGRAAEDLETAGRSLYTNGKRVLVHEQNTAFHEADVLAAEESPAVKALQWRLSPAHRFLSSSPDVCDVLADRDLHGMGPGRYHPGSAPSLPHPYCECSVEAVTVDPEEFGQIRYDDDQPPNQEPREIQTDEVESTLRGKVTDNSGSVTQNRIERAMKTADRKVRVAYDKFTDF